MIRKGRIVVVSESDQQIFVGDRGSHQASHTAEQTVMLPSSDNTGTSVPHHEDINLPQNRGIQPDVGGPPPQMQGDQSRPMHTQTGQAQRPEEQIRQRQQGDQGNQDRTGGADGNGVSQRQQN